MIAGFTLQAFLVSCLGACPPLVKVDISRDGSGLPGQTVSVRVNIDNAECLESMDLKLGYDPALLEVQDGNVRPGTLTAGELMVPNVDPANGSITVGLAILEPKGPGGGSLLEIDFKIRSSLSPLREQMLAALDLRSLSLNEDGLVLNPKPIPGPDQSDGQILILPDAPDIEVIPTSLDFPDVLVGSSQDKTFTIKSTGKAPLEVRSVALRPASSVDFKIKKIEKNSMPLILPAILPPGQSALVTVTYAPGEPGADTGTVEVNNNARPPVEVKLSGSGLGIPRIEVSPGSLEFGPVAVGVSKQMTCSIKSVGTASLEVQSVALKPGSSPDFQVTGITPNLPPLSLPPGSSAQVTVTYTPGQAGADSGTVEIKDNAQPVDVSLSGNGTGVLFRRGDADANGQIELTDAIKLLNYLFLGQAKPECLDAADTDDSGEADISDAISNLNYQFLGAIAPAPPGPTVCGIDPGQEVPDLGCDVGCR